MGYVLLPLIVGLSLLKFTLLLHIYSGSVLLTSLLVVDIDLIPWTQETKSTIKRIMDEIAAHGVFVRNEVRVLKSNHGF